MTKLTFRVLALRERELSEITNDQEARKSNQISALNKKRTKHLLEQSREPTNPTHLRRGTPATTTEFTQVSINRLSNNRETSLHAVRMVRATFLRKQ